MRSGYTVPKDIPPRKPKAYVVTIEADAYDEPRRQLRFAVRDCEAMSQALSELEGCELLPVSLASEGTGRKGWQASEGDIRDVLARLAVQDTAPETLAGVKGTQRLVIDPRFRDKTVAHAQTSGAL